MPKGDYWKKITKEEKELRIKRREETNLKKYGVEYPAQNKEIQEKYKQTNLKKYGVEYPAQNKEIQEKIKETNLERYGVEHPSQNKKVQNKMKETNLERYGVENPGQNKKVQEKTKESKLKIYYIKLFQSKRLGNLIKPLFSLEEYKGTKKNIYKFQCVKCNTIFESYLDDGHIPRCFKCYPISNFTIPHKIICEYLDGKNIKFETEKFIKPYYVDIFIEHNKIIEIYGDYWHGNPKIYKEGEILYFPNGKILIEDQWERDKKRIKYLENLGFKTLILWEDEIHNNFSLVKEEIKKFIK